MQTARDTVLRKRIVKTINNAASQTLVDAYVTTEERRFGKYSGSAHSAPELRNWL
jgi:hypothetical protein